MKRLFSLLLCLVLLLALAPIQGRAATDDYYTVLEIPVRKTVAVTQGTPENTVFTLEVDGSALQDGTQYTVLDDAVNTTGAGEYTATLRIGVATENDFWNMTEGFVVREKNTALTGWTYDATEWLIAPYEHENDPGTVPEKEIRIAIYNGTAGETIDFHDFKGSHEAIALTNTFAGPEAAPDPAETETPLSVEIAIPYTKTVRADAGVTAPARDFRLNVAEVPPTALENCEITGDRIETRGAGTYSGTLRVRPKNGDALAALMNGFTVYEAREESDVWTLDRAEWFVALENNSLGGISTTLYNLTAGDTPGESKGREELTFTNTYTPAAAPTPTPAPSPAPEEKDTVTVTYEPNGGTLADNTETVAKGTSVSLDRVPGRDSWTFLGWFESRESTQRLQTIRPETDVTVYAHWRRTPVPEQLNGNDHGAYVIGYEDHTVRPLNQITRAEVTMIFYRLLKEDIRQTNHTLENTFADVSADAWYNEAVSTMARIGIIKGRSDTVFDPNAPITRAEYAAICARFDKSEAPELSSFTDIGGHWAEKEIKHAVAIGWVRGYADGTFLPNNPITRAESMTLTNRVLQRLPAAAGDLLEGMRTFSDNADPSVWYYIPVQEATNAHEYSTGDDGHESWSKLLG